MLSKMAALHPGFLHSQVCKNPTLLRTILFGNRVTRPCSALDLETFSKRGTVDKAVRDSILGAAVGLGVAVVGIPAAAGALGFTAAGIAAGSIGAKMMSAAAIANGGGVAAGGVVATLQSIGAAGVPAAVSAAITATGAALGALKDLCS
ncbi:interferon alpha-inducible protein 27-like protein 2A isoform X1 [Crotalus tigris]|uniref:interferon alpha-inducible protein 27-like protein 2A isoform X1 n=1 Tax=Crotalus tigris TaxID=88082 RepID=UPI00192FAD06|nr:interferon alpha-inducible protein 27-like protein 2A isoform X1 [Crotalus tigris]XP_039209294.1 interferon alpha-inducible protein 27-like protein 2A isoform X1 [Crotalus tigris]